MENCNECGYLHNNKKRLPKCYNAVGCPAIDLAKPPEEIIINTWLAPSEGGNLAPTIKDLPDDSDPDVQLYKHSFTKGNRGALVCDICGTEAEARDKNKVTNSCFTDGWRVVEGDVVCEECRKEERESASYSVKTKIRDRSEWKIEIYTIQSDHILAIPQYYSEKLVEGTRGEVEEHILRNMSDNYGHPYEAKAKHGFTHISIAGALKVSKFEPNIRVL